tara:strand:+ start:460 stop:723 length:264 start_codon:yes stop_codon:yes gene_type:complete
MESKLEIKLKKIEKELDKVRTSSFVDGWQTSKHAKKSRKWDELAKEKFKLKKSLDIVNSCKYLNHNDSIFNHGECFSCGENYERFLK